MIPAREYKSIVGLKKGQRTHFLIKTLGVLLMMVVVGCSPKLQPSINTQTHTSIRDSLVIHRDTITYQIPVESTQAHRVQYSHLETTVATSDAWVDSIGTLSHKLENKPVKVEKEIVYVDRVVTEYRDSLVTKEVPVRVFETKYKTPKWCWWLLAFNVLVLVCIGIRLYLKLNIKV